MRRIAQPCCTPAPFSSLRSDPCGPSARNGHFVAAIANPPRHWQGRAAHGLSFVLLLHTAFRPRHLHGPLTRPRLTISNSARCRLELELEEACAANRHGHRLRGTVSGGCGLGEVVADDKTGQNRAPTETLLSRCVQTFELLRQHAAVVGGHPCGGVGFVPHDHRACSRAQAAGLLNRHDSLAALFDHRRRRLFLAHHSSTRSEHSTMIHMNRLRNPRFRADNELLFQPE